MGRLHPRFNPYSTRTGRFSSSDPNFQNLPKYATLKDAEGYIDVRRAVVPAPGHTLISLDYSQIELRIAAWYSGETVMVESFKNGENIHDQLTRQFYAAEMSLADALVHPEWKLWRAISKNVIFSILYGAGPKRIASMLKISLTAAVEILNRWRARFPRLAAFITRAETQARLRPIENLFGRVYNIPRDRTYIASNYLTQGSAADLIKEAMLRVQKELEARWYEHAWMIGTIHDEILLEARIDQAVEVIAAVRPLMEDWGDMFGEIPIVVDAEVSPLAWSEREEV